MTKNKNDSKATKVGFPFAAIAFVLILAGLTVVRYLQYSRVINPINGFFTPDGGMLADAYYLTMTAAAFILLVCGIVDKRGKRGVASGYIKPIKDAAKENADEVMNEILAEFAPQGSETSESAKKAADAKDKKDKKARDEALTPPVPRAWNTQLNVVAALFGAIFCGYCGAATAFWVYMEHTELNALRIALGIAAALGFLYTAFSVIAYRKLVPTTALALLFVAAHCACESAAEFMERAYTANMTTRLVLLGANLLLAVFLLSAGRIVVRSETRFTALCTTVAGYLAAGVIFSEGMAVFSHQNGLTDETRLLWQESTNGLELPTILFLMRGAVVIWLLYTLSAGARNKDSDEKIQEDIAKDSQSVADNDNGDAPAVES
ncbi:MAG: hypothetical protein FWG45_01365 [Oscillospiraceae bacterium]|nr:hypothetical protein [Oscillospiraceae bacterium]